MRHVLQKEVDDFRSPEHDILSVLYERWSPRAMSGEGLRDGELKRLFEAARWAPSSYNGQPWRFVHARRDTPYWREFFALLGDFNRTWAEEAAVLVVLLSRKTFEHNDRPARTHSLDTGAALQNLALQGRAMNVVVRAMGGCDYGAAADLLDLSDDYSVEAMIAIGRPAETSVLDDELEEREEPSGRKPIRELAFEGRLPRSEH